MGWLVLGGVALLALLFKGSGGAAPAARPPAPSLPVVPPPPPAPGSTVVVDDSSHDGGVISPPEGMTAQEAIVISPDTLPESLLAVVQQGSSANEAELRSAIAEATRLGRADLVRYFEGRLARRASYTRAQRGGAAPPAPRDVPIPAQSFAPEALPVAATPRDELRQYALAVADSVRRSAHRRYDMDLVRAFQRAAGLLVDGKYGRQTAQAVGHYGRLPAGQVPASQY